jgi:hypothetical protein
VPSHLRALQRRAATPDPYALRAANQLPTPTAAETGELGIDADSPSQVLTQYLFDGQWTSKTAHGILSSNVDDITELQSEPRQAVPTQHAELQDGENSTNRTSEFVSTGEED